MNDTSVSTGPGVSEWALLLPLFREINDLKRVRSPVLQPSVAAAWFRSAARLFFHSNKELDKSTRTRLALKFTADIVAATRLGAILDEDLEAGGLSPKVIRKIRVKAISERREILGAELLSTLLEATVDSECVKSSIKGTNGFNLYSDVSPTSNDTTQSAPTWIDRLIAQPRAGATAPGQPRIVLEPVESCAEHCLVTAVYAVLLANSFGADAGDAFMVGLAHHIHNAQLPDAGFAGEALIDDYLDGLIETLRESTMSTMSSHAADRLKPMLTEIASADTPLARTFHTADTIDRVLQIEYFARCNQFTLNDALVGMELVHAGPVQAFQQAQLDMAGLGSL